MKTFKFFWTAHKWTGIVLALVFLMTAASGFLLLVKKDYDWIQPPTQRGAAGEPADFLPIEQVLDAAIATGHPAFATFDDIDRIDFRPGKRIHKVRSNHDWMEVQVCAITGELLSGPEARVSDLVEAIHDGSYFGDFVHGWVMPIVTVALVFLVFSGLWLWIEPIVKRRRRRRARQAPAAG